MNTQKSFIGFCIYWGYILIIHTICLFQSKWWFRHKDTRDIFISEAEYIKSWEGFPVCFADDGMSGVVKETLNLLEREEELSCKIQLIF